MKVCSLWVKDIVGYMNDFKYVVVIVFVVVDDNVNIDVIQLVLIYFNEFQNDGLKECYKVIDVSKKFVLMDCLYIDLF